MGDGPISTSGKIGGIANLTLPNYVEMADGTIFHVINYGKNLMGSYAGQLTRKQRWQMVQYIRTLQPKPEGGTPAGGAPGTDSTGVKGTANTVKGDSAAAKI
ncbi:MAG: cytochrome c [Ferruginibacter sp.]